jgi:hypothetical protein
MKSVIKMVLFGLLGAATFARGEMPGIINYQGRVVANGINFTGPGDFKFALVDATGSVTYWSNDGSSVEGLPPSESITLNVDRGMFSVLLGDSTLSPHMTPIPPAVFDQSDVRLCVWFNDRVHGFEKIAPNLRVGAAGYALRAAGAWSTIGNAGTSPADGNFLGTSDNQPLELRVNNSRVLRLENAILDGSPNIIGGDPVNFVSSGKQGATIAGGGDDYFIRQIFPFPPIHVYKPNQVTEDFGTIAGGLSNRVDGYAAFLGGGEGNRVIGNGSVVGGGLSNRVDGYAALVGGGEGNQAIGKCSVVGGGGKDVAGGLGNIANGDYDVVAGGHGNTANGGLFQFGGGELSGWYGGGATIPGGWNNTANGECSFAAGRGARALHANSFVWGSGGRNDSYRSTTAWGQFVIDAYNGVFISESDLYLRKTDDGAHGLGWYGAGKPFGTNTGIDGPVLYGYSGGALGDKYHGTVALRWTSDGKVGVGGAVPTANALEVAGQASKTAPGGFVANSDARIKQDIGTITNALDTLARVRLVSFRYTEAYRAAHPSLEDRPYLNVIAQEFQQVFPDQVKGSGEFLPDGNEILQVDPWPVTIYAAAAAQELARRNADLERNVQELKATTADLAERLAALEQALRQGR